MHISLEQMWNDLNIKIDRQLKYVLGRMISCQYKQRFPDAIEALKALKPTEIKPPIGDQFRAKGKLFFILLGVIGLAGAGITGMTFVNKPNYTQLETYLQNKQWQQADAETNKLILKIAGKNSALDAESSQKIDCESLEKIDQVWMENSEGRFGFTPQKKVYLETGNNFDEYVESTYEAFGNQVNWRIFGAWKRYEDFNFQEIDTKTTPSGYLPSPGKVAADKQDLRIREQEMLLSRFDACGL